MIELMSKGTTLTFPGWAAAGVGKFGCARNLVVMRNVKGFSAG